MTIAVCLKCGAMKHGAWTPCRKCGHIPQDPEDVAKHLMTTDHYFSRSDLQAMAARLQSGQPLHFDPKNVADIVASLSKDRPDDKKFRRFVFAFVGVIIVLLVAAIVLGIYSVARFLTR